MAKGGGVVVSFRLNGSSRNRLDYIAEKHQMSAHEYARKLVVDQLSDVETDQLRMKMSSFENELSMLKRGLANAVEVILVSSGRVGKSEAKDWVNDHIRR